MNRLDNARLCQAWRQELHELKPNMCAISLKALSSDRGALRGVDLKRPRRDKARIT